MYNGSRLIVIVCLIAANGLLSIAGMIQHRYPLGIAAVLFLLPALQREMDMKRGRQPRKMGSFQWSCLLAGALFLFVLPVLVL